jgi:hypothetical protein
VSRIEQGTAEENIQWDFDFGFFEGIWVEEEEEEEGNFCFIELRGFDSRWEDDNGYSKC